MQISSEGRDGIVTLPRKGEFYETLNHEYYYIVVYTLFTCIHLCHFQLPHLYPYGVGSRVDREEWFIKFVFQYSCRVTT